VRLPGAPLACALAWLLAAGCATSRSPQPPAAKPPSAARRPAGRTVADVLATLGPAAERRLRARFAAAGVVYPPPRAHLLAFKTERRIELWATGIGRPRRVTVYPMLDDSGTVGPKLREGDYQIPEGIYRVVWLHPNSQYHLSMKLDYPSAYDRARAAEDGRTDLGGDIFIHGKDVSIGCLAVGDPAIEELFVLAARVGVGRVTTVIAPWDLRRRPPPEADDLPPWVGDLYARVGARLAAFR
jgi:hypothetical protein